MTASPCRVCGKPNSFRPGSTTHDACDEIIARHTFREHHGATTVGSDPTCVLCVYGESPMGQTIPDGDDNAEPTFDPDGFHEWTDGERIALYGKEW